MQSELLRRGETLFSADIAEKNCDAVLTLLPKRWTDAKLGIWSDKTTAIKKTAKVRGGILSWPCDLALYGGRGQSSVR